MELNTNNSTETEFLDSDHLLHENRILRKVIKEKDQELSKLKYENEFLRSVIKTNENKHNQPWGT